MVMKRKPLKRVLFLVGPTATGKTRLAVKLAKKIGGEVISCDSMQVYKGMRILSQAPSGADSRGIRHHLVSFIPPGKNFSVAEFRKAAAKKIRQIFERGHTPIVVGGSGLYAKALMDGLFPSPGADLKRRERSTRTIRGAS
jgi:tRNA dimethylallyltransferase